MAKQQKFRWPTIVTAATCLVLACFCLWWVFAAYKDYRSVDFTLVSAGAVSPASCVAAATDKQLKEAKYDQTGWSCSTGSKEELSNLLAVSVHAMYAANAAAAYTGDAKAVYDAVVSAAEGTDSGYSITREHAYAALSVVGTPSSTDCATIYGETAEVAVSTPVAPTVVCDADVPASNPAPTVTPTTSKLFTHCMQQFAYGRSYPAKGTMTIPKVGTEPKPTLLPVIATNSTTHYTDRARILVGTRWGYSTVFYVFLMMGTAFFIMDCSVLLLAELTRVDAYFAQNAIVEGAGRSMREGVRANETPNRTHTRCARAWTMQTDAWRVRSRR
jgi:hypothetical protein